MKDRRENPNIVGSEILYIKWRMGIQKLMLSLKMRVFSLRRHDYVSYT